MQSMHIDIQQDNQRFQSRLKLWNFAWIAISFLSIFLSSYSAFNANPGYLKDWHGPVIILLTALTMTVYCAGIFTRFVFGRGWPPPYRRAIIFWCAIYLLVSLLSFINPNFTFSYFIALGMSFALFRSRMVIPPSAITFLSFCYFQGWLSMPFTQDKLGNTLGIGMSFLSMTLTCLWIQHLISERYERNQLLGQLSHANSELQAAHQRLQETAAQEQELAVLRERARLAREMHDTLGHALVLISIKLEAAHRLRERDPERCDRELEATKEIARNTMNELRASIANLRSPALQHESTCSAISRYARDMALRTGLRLTCDYDQQDDIARLPEHIEDALWKVGQEALTNVEKHARAQHVQLHFSRQNSHVVMRIADDGVGFPPELRQLHAPGDMTCVSPQGHYGISGMVERVESAGGRLFIRPGMPRGTTVEVELPLVAAP